MPRPVRRALFALVLTRDPMAIDIFRQDEVEIEDGQIFGPAWEVTVERPSWQDSAKGRVLRTGTKISLSKLRVKVEFNIDNQENISIIDHDHQIDGGTFLTSRCKALLSRKVTVRQQRLEALARNLATDGLAGVPQAAPSVVRRVKPNDPEEVQRMEVTLSQLKYKESVEGVTQEISPGIHVNQIKLLSIVRRLKKQPSKMFFELMEEVIGLENMKNPVLGRVDSKHKVAIPKDVVDAVDSFVLGNSKGLEYDRDQVLSDRLYYLQNKEDILKKKRQREENIGAAAAAAAAAPQPNNGS